MAFQRLSDVKIKGDSLDVFVSNLDKAYSRQITLRNAEDELKFHKLVLEENLPLASQLEYRKNQLKRKIDDKDEKKRLNEEVSNLKDRIEQKEFTDTYIQKLTDFEAGVTSIDSVLQWLLDRKGTTTDQTILQEINKQIHEKESTRYNIVKNTIQNQTQRAVNDKTGSLLDNQLDKVNQERTKALIAGDQLLVSTFDLQIQSLNKAKIESTITNDLTNFAVSAVSGYATAVNLLDLYNSKISSAGIAGAITIGGTTYGSAREFWTFKRDSYISDNSGNGFFAQFKQEVDNKIATQNSRNELSEGSLRNETSAYDGLSARPELQAFESQIAIFRQSSLQKGADQIATNVFQKYQVDFDINAALGSLNSLKSAGVNVTDTLTKVIQTGSQIKNTQVSNILSTANDLIATGLSAEEAISQAIAQGAGATLSPEESINKSGGDIATDFAKGFQNESFKDDPRLTAGGQDQNQTPTSTPTATPPDQPSTGAKTYRYVDVTGNLKTIQANSPEDALARAVDKASNSGIQIVNTPAPSSSTPSSTPTPTSTSTPAPTPVKTTPTTPIPVATPTPQQPTLNTYQYVNTSGQLQKIQASSSNDAIAKAPNIAKNSGVQLIK